MRAKRPERELRVPTTPRSAALPGVAFALLFAASLILVNSSIPSDIVVGEVWADGAQSRLKWALTLMPFAGIAFLWFMGVVRDLLGDREDRFFSSVYFGSGLLFLAMIFVSMALAGGIIAIMNSGMEASLQTPVVSFGRAVMLQVTGVYAVKMAAVFMISLASTWLRTGLMPRWLVVVTYVVALTLLLVTSVTAWVALVFPGWVLVVSVYVLVITRRAAHQAAQAA